MSEISFQQEEGGKSKRNRTGISWLEIVVIILILLVIGAVTCPIDHVPRKKAQIDSEGRSNMVAIQAQLAMEQQIGKTESFPLHDCLNTQVVAPPNDVCPMRTCPSFVYTAAIGAQIDDPGFCFVVTELRHDPEDPEKIIGYTLEGRGMNGRVKGVVLRMNEDMESEPELIAYPDPPWYSGCTGW